MPKKNTPQSLSTNPDLAWFPKESAAPKVGNPPPHQKKLPNWAGDEALCDHLSAIAATAYSKYVGQSERSEGVARWKSSDLKYRASQVNNNEKDADMPEQVSDLSDTGYHVRINTFVSQIMDVLYGTDELPAKYQPLTEHAAGENIEPEIRETTDNRNLWETYVWTRDNRKEKFRECATWTAVDANLPVKVEWAREEKDVSIKTVSEWFPTELDANGDPLPRRPKKFKTETKKIRKSWPSWKILDNRNFFADAQILTSLDPLHSNLKNQRLILERDQVDLGDIWGLQEQGHYMNAGKITKAQLFTDEGMETIMFDRRTNAGVAETMTRNGLLDHWIMWARLPINDKGKWDEENTLARWVVAEFVGQIGGKMICLAIRPNPHANKELPYFFTSSHLDRRGLYSMGFHELGNDWYNASKTNMDQAFDNITRRTKGMYYVNGPLNTRNLQFQSGKVIKGTRGTSLVPLSVDDATQITIELRRVINEEWDQAFTTTTSLQGQVFGQRTSALEAGNARTEAQKPALNLIEHFAEPLLRWILMWDRAMTDQYADPDDVVAVTGDTGIMKEIKPAELWGSSAIVVTAITEFEDNLLRRQELNGLLPNVEVFGLGPDERRTLGRVMAKEFKIPERERIFPPIKDGDAEDVANRENDLMLSISDPLSPGEPIPPKEDENKRVHLRSHKSARVLYARLPKEQRNEENLGIIDFHIAETEDGLERETASAAQGSQQAATNQPTNVGEQAQQSLGALMGGQQ